MLRQVDVEGAELEVLRGMDDACWAATRQLLVEVGGAVLPGSLGTATYQQRC
jgi:hypothetical protein